MAVATVGPASRVVMKPVTIVQDLGATVEVAARLTPVDRVIDSPPDSLRPGDLVRIAPTSAAADQAGGHAAG
jgi:hypothetical protein